MRRASRRRRGRSIATKYSAGRLYVNSIRTRAILGPPATIDAIVAELTVSMLGRNLADTLAGTATQAETATRRLTSMGSPARLFHALDERGHGPSNTRTSGG